LGGTIAQAGEDIYNATDMAIDVISIGISGSMGQGKEASDYFAPIGKG